MSLRSSVSGLWDDVKFGGRLLTKRIGASAAIVFTMATAFASSTVIYSTVDVVQHLVPAPDRARLVFVDAHDPRRGRNRTGVSVPDLIDWTQRNRTFEDLAAFGFVSMNLTGLDAPLRVATVRTSGNFFSQWGVKPAFGRLFVPADSAPGAERVVAITDWFWRSQLGSQPGLIGRSFVLDGEPHVLVGILPPEMSSGIFWHEEIFVPLRLSATATPRDQRALFVTGRLKVGVDREQAAADLTRIARQLETEYPRTNTTIGATVRPLLELVGGNTPFAVFVLTLVAALLMAVACTNVANVLLAQLLGRRREFAVRRALGASRGQQVRQILVESLLCSAVAGSLAVLLAYWSITGVRAVSQDAVGFNELALNGRVLMFAIALCVAAPLAFAVVPAWRASATSFDEVVHGTRSSNLSVRSGRLQRVLVVTQIAFALILMLEVGFIARTTRRLLAADTGLDAQNVLTFRIALPESRYREPGLTRSFFSTAIDRLGHLPTVHVAAATSRLPISDRDVTVRFTIEGQPVADPNQQPWAGRVIVTPNYFRTLGVPILRGRDFTSADAANSPGVALVSQRMASRYWHDREVIGQRVRFMADGRDEQWIQVVGVVADIRNADASAEPNPLMYVPATQLPATAMVFVLRTASANPLSMTNDVRRAIASIDKDQPVYEVFTMQQVLAADLRGTAMFASILATIALVAVGLATIGVYGVVAHSVSQRTHELGIRMALGASRVATLRLVMVQAAVPVGIGAAIGIAAGIALMRFSLGALKGSTPSDIAVGSVLLLVGVVTMGAIYVPARRVTTIDPAVALRYE